MIRRLTRLLLALSSVLVPSDRREDWLEEWWAEIEGLDDARRSGIALRSGPDRTRSFA